MRESLKSKNTRDNKSPEGLVVLLIFSLFVGTIPFILKLISLTGLRDWARHNLGSDFASQEIIEGTNSMRTGAIISIIPFIGFIGMIIYYVKMKKVGESLINKFGTAY